MMLTVASQSHDGLAYWWSILDRVTENQSRSGTRQHVGNGMTTSEGQSHNANQSTWQIAERTDSETNTSTNGFDSAYIQQKYLPFFIRELLSVRRRVPRKAFPSLLPLYVLSDFI